MDQAFKQSENNTRLRRQILQRVEYSIRDKVPLPGQRLPTEQELSTISYVSRQILRKPLQLPNTRVLTTVRKVKNAFLNVCHATLPPDTIFNIVSADKVQEFPDQNAAESIGRLTDISILRDAGEAN